MDAVDKGTEVTKMGIVSEEMTFIRRDGNRIRGRIYLREEKGGKLPLVIFCHGFGSNYRELEHHGEGFAEAGSSPSATGPWKR